jgi:hypothetical protein
MQWYAILERLAALLRTDPVLVGLYGDRMRLMGTGAHAVPMLEWMLVADAETELWEPCTIQIDQWVTASAALEASERRLRELLHHETPIAFGGITTWAQYLDGQILASPDRDGYIGRAVRFRLTPIRERYTV